MKTSPRILMCPPDYYEVRYEINPWMSRQRACNPQLAFLQWHRLRMLLQRAGATVALLPSVARLPDMVFTANAALIYDGHAILSHFRPWQRRGEEPFDRHWFESAGFEVRSLPEGTFFEGAGDALFCGDTLFAGYRIRSEAASHRQIGEMIQARVLPLELVERRFYHLDTCFCPLSADSALYYPGAFDQYGRRSLKEAITDLIEVDDTEARRFACNAVVVGRTVITNTGCPKLHHKLCERGFLPCETPMGEFVKSGGSAKCLTLRLDGEEAMIGPANYGVGSRTMLNQ